MQLFFFFFFFFYNIIIIMPRGSAVYHHKYRFIIPFLAPAVVLYATFVLWPYAESFYVALTDWKGCLRREVRRADEFRQPGQRSTILERRSRTTINCWWCCRSSRWGWR